MPGQVSVDPLNDVVIAHLRAHGLLRMNDSQVRRLREFLARKLLDLNEPDQDEQWLRKQRKYYMHQWRDEFFMLSELVESPIEQQLGGYLLCIIDGYNEVSADFFPGAFPDPDFGTYLRCQQEVFGNRLDFLFKINLHGDWKALNVECDGHPFHEKTKEQAARDRSRDRYLIYDGYQVIRFSGSEIYNRPRKCAAEVEAVLHRLMRDLLATHGLERRRRPPTIPDQLLKPETPALQ